MAQVSMIGYAAAGAFLGLAYFDLYYTLVAVIVVCNVILQKQIDSLQSVPDATVPGANELVRKNGSEALSVTRKS
jgi:hypothetical protein